MTNKHRGTTLDSFLEAEGVPTEMNDEAFQGLMESIDQARALARGEAVEGLRAHAERPIDIAAVRKRAGLTQAEFSRQIGISAATLRNWDQGRRKPEAPPAFSSRCSPETRRS